MICDLAQTYGIWNYKDLPPSLVATLVIGLGENSRIMKKQAKARLSYQDSILALIFDSLQVISYKLGHRKGQEKPKSLYKKLTEEKKKDDLKAFKSPEDFDKWRKEHVNG